MVRGSILHSHPRICIDEEHHLQHRVSIMAWDQHLASRWYTGSERIEDCMVGFMNQTLKECLTLPMACHQLKRSHKKKKKKKNTATNPFLRTKVAVRCCPFVYSLENNQIVFAKKYFSVVMQFIHTCIQTHIHMYKFKTNIKQDSHQIMLCVQYSLIASILF